MPTDILNNRVESKDSTLEHNDDGIGHKGPFTRVYESAEAMSASVTPLQSNNNEHARVQGRRPALVETESLPGGLGNGYGFVDQDVESNGYRLSQEKMDPSSVHNHSGSSNELTRDLLPKPRVASSTFNWILKAEKSQQIEMGLVFVVSLVASFLQTTFVYHAEEDYNSDHRFEVVVDCFLAIVFFGYAVVNIGFSENVVRRLKCQSKALEWDESLGEIHLFLKLDTILPETVFKRKYPLSYPLRGFFFITEFVFAVFAVILNVASFYVFCNSKKNDSVEKNLLIALGIIISLPYVGLNLIPTEKVTTFLMSLMSRHDVFSDEERGDAFNCLQWLSTIIPGPKEAGLLFLVTILDALGAVQAFRYGEILSEGGFPYWFDAVMQQELLIATINFGFLFATKFEKTKKLLYIITGCQQNAEQSVNNQQNPLNRPLAWVSFFFGICMASKAFIPSYTTFRQLLLADTGSVSSLERGALEGVVYLLTFGSGFAPTAFYSMKFYDATYKAWNRYSSPVVSEEVVELGVDRVQNLLGRLHDFVTMKGELSRHLVVKLRLFLERPEMARLNDQTFILELVAHFYQVMQLKGQAKDPVDCDMLSQRLELLTTGVHRSTIMVDFDFLMTELRKKDNYDNDWYHCLAVILCGVFSVVSSFGYAALLMNSVDSYSAVKNTLAVIVAVSVYIISHERIAYRLGELLNFLKTYRRHGSDVDRQEINNFYYASLSPSVVHAFACIVTLTVVLEMLAGLVSFVACRDIVRSNHQSTFVSILGGSVSLVLAPYLCIPLYLYFTNGPTKDNRQYLMGFLSRPMIAKMLLSQPLPGQIPSNFSGISELLAEFDKLYTVCLAWSVLEGDKHFNLFSMIALSYYIASSISQPSRVLDSGRMFRSFFSPREQNPVEPTRVPPMVDYRSPMASARNNRSLATIDHSSSSSLSLSNLQPDGAANVGDTVFGAASFRVLSDILSGWLKSVYFIRYLNPDVSLMSADVMVSSVLLSTMMLFGRSVIEGKGKLLRNKRSLLDFIGPRSPKSRSRHSPVNSPFFLKTPLVEADESEATSRSDGHQDRTRSEGESPLSADRSPLSTYFASPVSEESHERRPRHVTA